VRSALGSCGRQTRSAVATTWIQPVQTPVAAVCTGWMQLNSRLGVRLSERPHTLVPTKPLSGGGEDKAGVQVAFFISATSDFKNKLSKRTRTVDVSLAEGGLTLQWLAIAPSGTSGITRPDSPGLASSLAHVCRYLCNTKHRVYIFDITSTM